MPPCRVCGTEEVASWPGTEKAIHYECDVCGRYILTYSAMELLSALSDRRLLPYLSAHFRQATDAGQEPPYVTTANWEELARAHANIPVAQKVQRLLEYVASRSSVGDWLPVRSERALSAALDMRNADELRFVLNHVQSLSLLKNGSIGGRPDKHGGFVDMDLGLQLTVEGWNKVAPVGGGVPGTCFVAMSFDPSLNTAFTDGIVPALEVDCGFRVIRVDRVHHNDNITDRIIGGIRSAQFVVADFTLQRQGVYYEAGFAQGLGRPVIRTCRADDFDQLHFDTRQFFHLKWSTPVDLRTLLADHIRATIQSRPTAV